MRHLERKRAILFGGRSNVHIPVFHRQHLAPRRSVIPEKDSNLFEGPAACLADGTTRIPSERFHGPLHLPAQRRVDRGVSWSFPASRGRGVWSLLCSPTSIHMIATLRQRGVLFDRRSVPLLNGQACRYPFQLAICIVPNVRVANAVKARAAFADASTRWAYAVGDNCARRVWNQCWRKLRNALRRRNACAG
jgi:hypothetical protein